MQTDVENVTNYLLNNNLSATSFEINEACAVLNISYSPKLYKKVFLSFVDRCISSFVVKTSYSL